MIYGGGQCCSESSDSLPRQNKTLLVLLHTLVTSPSQWGHGNIATHSPYPQAFHIHICWCEYFTKLLHSDLYFHACLAHCPFMDWSCPTVPPWHGGSCLLIVFRHFPPLVIHLGIGCGITYYLDISSSAFLYSPGVYTCLYPCWDCCSLGDVVAMATYELCSLV